MKIVVIVTAWSGNTTSWGTDFTKYGEVSGPSLHITTFSYYHFPHHPHRRHHPHPHPIITIIIF
jgi:hypothetical protein